MPLNPLPMPLDTPMVNEDRTIEFDSWVTFFTFRDQLLQSAAKTVTQAIVSPTTGGSGAIGATALNVGTFTALYRVNLYARITRAATTSSSLTPTFRWTEGVVALSRTYTAMTGNTTGTYLVDVFPVRIDPNTALTYETAYASVGGTSMTYMLEINIERLA